MEPWAMPIPPCLGGSSYSACAGAVLFLPRPEPVDSGWSADVRFARARPLAHCVSVSPFGPSAASDDVRYSAAPGGQAAGPLAPDLRVHGPSLPSATEPLNRRGVTRSPSRLAPSPSRFPGTHYKRGSDSIGGRMTKFLVAILAAPSGIPTA